MPLDFKQIVPFSQSLEDLTNLTSDRNCRLSSTLLENSPKSSPKHYTLRSSKSHHTLKNRFHSSESIASTHPSIYDAELVLSTEDVSEKKLPFNEEDRPLPAPGIPLSPSFEDLSQLAGCQTSSSEPSLPSYHTRSNSHSNWPAAHLDTIVEQLSHQTTGTTPSLPRSSLSSKYTIASINIHTRNIENLTRSTKSIQKRNCRSAPLFHYRSFSLNDLDCLTISVSHHYEPDSSSSSDGELQTACLCPAYPMHPHEPPPERIPTPPGLPSFGTRAAMEYQMPSNFQRMLGTVRRDSYTSREHDTSVPGTQDAPGTAERPTSSNNPSTSLLPLDALKRLLGMNRVVVSPPPGEQRRATMPNHLYLARADDGTYVRGRFGPRTSAHGIGRQGLEGHVYHQNGRGLSPITQVCADIDKACAEAEARTPPRSPSRSHSPTSERVSSASSNGNPRIRPHNQMASITAVMQGIPQVTTTEPTPVVSPARSRTFSLASSIAGGLSVPSQNMIDTTMTQTTNSAMDGVRQFIENGERDSLERQHSQERRRRERGKFETCWINFCSYCCDADVYEQMDLRRVTISPMMSGISVVEEQPRRMGRMAYY